jgi:hypothetical protein
MTKTTCYEEQTPQNTNLTMRLKYVTHDIDIILGLTTTMNGMA